MHTLTICIHLVSIETCRQAVWKLISITCWHCILRTDELLAQTIDATVIYFFITVRTVTRLIGITDIIFITCTRWLWATFAYDDETVTTSNTIHTCRTNSCFIVCISIFWYSASYAGLDNTITTGIYFWTTTRTSSTSSIIRIICTIMIWCSITTPTSASKEPTSASASSSKAKLCIPRSPSSYTSLQSSTIITIFI